MLNNSTDNSWRSLSIIIWAVFPFVMIAILVVLAFIYPEGFMQAFAKDTTRGGGIIEHGTVIVLLPGIIAGFIAFFKYRNRLSYRWLKWWLLILTLACVYFAGEEMSWGQHFFKFDTPDVLMAINDQREANIHNISSWFDQKPRALVEFWIIIGGIFVGLWNLMKKKVVLQHDWRFWFWPTYECIITAILVLFVRVLDWSGNWITCKSLKNFGSSELREYYVALFLSIYLLSFWFRLKQIKKQNTD